MNDIAGGRGWYARSEESLSRHKPWLARGGRLDRHGVKAQFHAMQ